MRSFILIILIFTTISWGSTFVEKPDHLEQATSTALDGLNDQLKEYITQLESNVALINKLCQERGDSLKASEIQENLVSLLQQAVQNLQKTQRKAGEKEEEETESSQSGCSQDDEESMKILISSMLLPEDSAPSGLPNRLTRRNVKHVLKRLIGKPGKTIQFAEEGIQADLTADLESKLEPPNFEANDVLIKKIYSIIHPDPSDSTVPIDVEASVIKLRDTLLLKEKQIVVLNELLKNMNEFKIGQYDEIQQFLGNNYSALAEKNTSLESKVLQLSSDNEILRKEQQEALQLSKTQLDESQRKISLLEATVEGQKVSLEEKESNINKISIDLEQARAEVVRVKEEKLDIVKREHLEENDKKLIQTEGKIAHMKRQLQAYKSSGHRMNARKLREVESKRPRVKASIKSHSQYPAQPPEIPNPMPEQWNLILADWMKQMPLSVFANCTVNDLQQITDPLKTIPAQYWAYMGSVVEDHAEHPALYFEDVNIDNVPTEVIANMNGRFIGNLPPSFVAQMDCHHWSKIKPDKLRFMTCAQLYVIPPVVFTCFTEEQLKFIGASVAKDNDRYKKCLTWSQWRKLGSESPEKQNSVMTNWFKNDPLEFGDRMLGSCLVGALYFKSPFGWKEK